jgi:hypothetical protein
MEMGSTLATSVTRLVEFHRGSRTILNFSVRVGVSADIILVFRGRCETREETVLAFLDDVEFLVNWGLTIWVLLVGLVIENLDLWDLNAISIDVLPSGIIVPFAILNSGNADLEDAVLLGRVDLVHLLTELSNPVT